MGFMSFTVEEMVNKLATTLILVRIDLPADSKWTILVSATSTNSFQGDMMVKNDNN